MTKFTPLQWETIRQLLEMRSSSFEQTVAFIEQPLSEAGVQQFLNSAPSQKVAELFYKAGLVKIAEMALLKQANELPESRNPSSPSTSVPGSRNPDGSSDESSDASPRRIS